MASLQFGTYREGYEQGFRDALDIDRKLRADLTAEQKAEALRIGRIEFKSAGTTREKRAPNHRRHPSGNIKEEEHTMSPCTLCGGDAGSFNPATHAHYLCEARHRAGSPTPCLGMRCTTCNGSGVKPGFRGGVMLSFDEGPARIAKSIAAQFPPCVECGGRGYSN
jgi:hypothetical protein